MPIAIFTVTHKILGTARRMHGAGIACNLVKQSLIEFDKQVCKQKPETELPHSNYSTHYNHDVDRQSTHFFP